MRVDYRPAPHGLCRWTDPVDQRAYVIGSGALDGARLFAAHAEGPADRMPTEVTVEPLSDGDVVRATRGDLASHHLGVAAGPWRVDLEAGVEVLSRQSVDPSTGIELLLRDTRRALDWLLDWFDAESAAPWGALYTQVLVPDAPWLAMEHPGCVLLSERLLDAPPGQRIAVLAHEAAHQWLGNVVSPRTWRDVGAFEGLAELLGQLACEALGGRSGATYLARRRSKRRLTLPPTVDDLRMMAATAGLAEVAGPVQHAELFRRLGAELGTATFQARLRDLVHRRAGSTCGAAELWAGLGVEARQAPTLRLPGLGDGGTPARWRDLLSGLDHCDPVTAAAAARRAFRTTAPGPARVRQALAAMSDPSTPAAVSAGLAAELSRGSDCIPNWSNHNAA